MEPQNRFYLGLHYENHDIMNAIRVMPIVTTLVSSDIKGIEQRHRRQSISTYGNATKQLANMINDKSSKDVSC